MTTNVDQQGRWIDVRNPTYRSVMVVCLQAGQAKPYGDSWYRYDVYLDAGRLDDATDWPNPFPTTADDVLKMAQPLISETLYTRQTAPHAFAPVIQTIEESEPGIWRIEARALYCD